MHGETSRVRRVRHDTEHVLQNVSVISLVKGLGSFGIARDILQKLEENIQSRIGDVAHRVFKSPNDGVKNKLELSGRNCQKRVEAE